ncbi:MAG: CHAT domain-containing protein [Nostoc sp. DedQUE05]|uniref:CHAT domain-containing protein n=1 Tax=Nostoc sp. DedQUE05 TaxID=3075391 RepID=UPI002AD26179|nr:CHAT domain-containing protein [Nostoc sp. DedQUE05]MDZ8091587.1 CHAT domain-containing protein [Nostoc sp. DedQUE05]
MAKQFSILKYLLLHSASHRVVLFSIALCLSSKVAIAQQQGSSLSTKLENLGLQANLTNLNFPTPGSSIESSKKTPTFSQYVESKDKPEPKVLIAEVVVTGVEGELQHIVYDTIQTKPGGISTYSLLKNDINAIFAIGYFSNVKAVPEDTARGVRVTFEVKQNPIFKEVKINSKILPQKIIQEAFQSQYGSILNLVNLKKGIKKIENWYLDNGYVLVDFVGTPKVTDDGTVTLEVAEGVIEDIQAQFVKIINGRSFNIQNDQPISGKTPKLLIIHDFRFKRGDVFNINHIRKELTRLKKTRDFNEIKIFLHSGHKPEKVVIQLNIEEKNIFVKTDESLQRLSQQAQPGSDPEQIIAKNQEIIKISRFKNDKKLEINALYNIGNTYNKLGEYSKSIVFYNQALELVRHDGISYEKLNNINPNAKDCNTFTQSRESINYCEQPIQVPKITPIEKTLLESNILLSLSNTYRIIGEYQQALSLNNQGLSLIENNNITIKDDINLIILKALAFFLRNYIYIDLGENEIANNYVNKGQEYIHQIQTFLVNSLEDSNSEEGNSYLENNNAIQKDFIILFSNLIPFILNQDEKQLLVGQQELWFQFLKITEQVDLEKLAITEVINFNQILNIFSKELLSLISLQIGKNYNLVGNKQKALEIYNKVLQNLQYLKISEIEPESKEQVNDINQAKDLLSFFGDYIKSMLLNETGNILADLDKKQEALSIYQQALKLSELTGEKEVQASILDGLGSVYYSLNKYEEAIDSYNQALKIWHEQGNSLAEANSQLGIARVERDRNRLYTAKAQIEIAIRLIESQPRPSEIDYSPNARTEQHTFKHYINLASYFSAKQNYYSFYIDLLMRLDKKFPSYGYVVQAFKANEQSKNRSLLAILNRRDRYVSNAKISNSSKTQYTNLAAVPLLSTIQQQVLDDDSILLEYALGEERSYLWVVSKTGFSSYELPKRAEIEAAARKFYDFMTIPSLRIRTNKAAKAGNDLSQMLLEQVASQLGNKRLLIVADGVLQYIPFGALPDFNSGFSQPLLVNHETLTLPSASTFAVLRNNKDIPSPTKTLAVLADPVFGQEDERFRGKPTKLSLQTKQHSVIGENQPSSSLVTEQLFPRLPSTRNEADQIASLVNPVNQIQKFGFSASRQAVLEPEMSQYRIIHFATHGILDAEKPERSGMLLSVINERGELQRSLLSTPDVFNLQLSAELVVLSGCRTGLGKQIKGEGLIGLTGGLMYAGAKRVVVSLWSVDDQATAALMSRFYQGILKEGLSPAKALREAQLAILKQPRWQNPYYWAAFTLQGEWK